MVIILRLPSNHRYLWETWLETAKCSQCLLWVSPHRLMSLYCIRLCRVDSYITVSPFLWCLHWSDLIPYSIASQSRFWDIYLLFEIFPILKSLDTDYSINIIISLPFLSRYWKSYLIRIVHHHYLWFFLHIIWYFLQWVLSFFVLREILFPPFSCGKLQVDIFSYCLCFSFPDKSETRVENSNIFITSYIITPHSCGKFFLGSQMNTHFCLNNHSKDMWLLTELSYDRL